MLELITDRTASDVANRTKKGYYSADDLNRVTTAMKYLDSELRKAGYESGYDPIVVHPESGGVLPEGYTELEYIESTGEQYIDTEFLPNSDTTIKTKVQGLSSDTEAIFGARESSMYPSFSLWSINGNLRVDFSSETLATEFKFSSLSEIEMKNGSFMINGELKSFQTASFSISTPILIFANYKSGSTTVDPRRATGRIYYFRIYNLYGKVADFVPCISPLGEIGLYDTKRDKFYSNSGGGSFVEGPEVIHDPEPDPIDQYTWLETDEPNRTQTEQYLSNVQKIRSTLSVFTSTPKTPKSMRLLNHTMANDIEKILLDVETVLTNMLKTVDLGWALGIAHTGLYGGV